MTSPAAKGPSLWYLVLAPFFLVLGAAGLIWCIVYFAMTVANGPVRFDGPGEHEARLDKPGKYSIYQMYPTNQSPTFDGSVERPYPRCSVLSADGKREIKVGYASESLTETINEQSGSPIYEFRIDQPGTYRIVSQRADGADKPKFMLGVGPQTDFAGSIVLIFIAPVVCFGSFVLAVLVVITVLVMRATAFRPPLCPVATPFPPPTAPPHEPGSAPSDLDR